MRFGGWGRAALCVAAALASVVGAADMNATQLDALIGMGLQAGPPLNASTWCVPAWGCASVVVPSGVFPDPLLRPADARGPLAGLLPDSQTPL
jgi:hypothetical protein